MSPPRFICASVQTDRSVLAVFGSVSNRFGPSSFFSLSGPTPSPKLSVLRISGPRPNRGCPYLPEVVTNNIYSIKTNEVNCYNQMTRLQGLQVPNFYGEYIFEPQSRKPVHLLLFEYINAPVLIDYYGLTLIPENKQILERDSFATRLRLVCDSFATRLRLVCDSFATRLRLVCDSFATRLRLVCDSFATRLRLQILYIYIYTVFIIGMSAPQIFDGKKERK